MTKYLALCRLNCAKASLDVPKICEASEPVK